MSHSSSASRMRSGVMSAVWLETSKVGNSLSTSLGAIPRRANSDTAAPRVVPVDSLSARAAKSTASSISKVVRIQAS